MNLRVLMVQDLSAMFAAWRPQTQAGASTEARLHRSAPCVSKEDESDDAARYQQQQHEEDHEPSACHFPHTTPTLLYSFLFILFSNGHVFSSLYSSMPAASPSDLQVQSALSSIA
jgi:hypothetical protein